MAELRPQFLYLIGERRDGPIKVGVARSPQDRRRELQTGHAGHLRIFWVYPCTHGAEIERVMHLILRPRRLVGEWFDVPIEAAMGALWIAAESSGPGEATEELIDGWRRHIGLTLSPVNVPTDRLASEFERRSADEWLRW